MPHERVRALLLAALSGLALLAPGPVPAAGPQRTELTFARVNDAPLLLDLYLPERRARAGCSSPPASTPVGLIIWVHGGAWRGGSRASVDLAGMTARGWAVASVDYRLSPVARFPAQAHDIKAAIRFLRAHAADYGYPSSRFVIAGSSAGGHLAALVGVSNAERQLEGNVGSDLSVSSDVQAVVSLYGASNLTSILTQSSPHGLSVRVPALELLLGGQPDSVPELTRLASPVFHVDTTDPPLLLLHGDQDNQMPIQQSYELEAAYQKLGLAARLVVVRGAGHGGPAFTHPDMLELIDGFLRQQLVQSAAATPANSQASGPSSRLPSPEL
jgi:acetyl esterase/lipase